MTKLVLPKEIVSQYRYISPTFFWGYYQSSHYVGPSAHRDGKTYIIPCKYADEQEVLDILLKQYKHVSQQNPNVTYPEFSDCVRYTLPVPRWANKNVKGAYICMQPIEFTHGFISN